MYEYNGWAVIRDDPHESDASALERIFQIIRDKVEELGDRINVGGTKFVNGRPVVWALGYSNHKNLAAFELFEFVAGSAPGAYGLLYIRDDEHPSNNFQVWRLARGRMQVVNDVLLSPCVPVIEDA